MTEKKHPINEDNEKETTSLHDITKELIEELKQSSNEVFMTLPLSPSDDSSENQDKNAIIDHIKTFNIRPKDIKTYLDRFVINQTNAKKALAISICDHYNYIKETLTNTSPGHYTKQNILMIGPTGVGKTYLIKRIAELIGVPFVKSDATKFTETGYQGGDVEDLVRQLYKKANHHIELAEHGIIYLDEVDKITGTQSSHHKDISGRGVQSNLLKIMEDTDVTIRPNWDIQAQIKQMMSTKKDAPSEKETINTKNILFIMSGAFNHLDDIIEKRLTGHKIGFDRIKKDPNNKDTSPIKNLRTKDLVTFGLEPEFAGRLPVRVQLNELSKTDLSHILVHSEESILEQYILSFKRFNIELYVNDDALDEIADIAYQEQIGARALSSTLENIFREFKFELPSTNIGYIYATKEFIQDPKKILENYLKSPKKQLTADIMATISNEIKKSNLTVTKDEQDTLLNQCLDESNKGHIVELIQNYMRNYVKTD